MIQPIIQSPHEPECFAVSSKYQVFATGDPVDKTIKLWDLRSGALLETLPFRQFWGHKALGKLPPFLSFANQHPWIAAYSEEMLVIYDYAEQRLIDHVVFKEEIHVKRGIWDYIPRSAIFFSTNDRYLHFDSFSSFFFDTRKLEPVYFNDINQISAQYYKGFYYGVTIDPAERYMAYHENPIDYRSEGKERFRVKDLQTGQLVFDQAASDIHIHRFSPSGKWLISFQSPYSLLIINTENWQERVVRLKPKIDGTHLEEITLIGNKIPKFEDLYITRDDKLVVYSYGNIFVYDLEKRAEVYNLPIFKKSGTYHAYGNLMIDEDLGVLANSFYYYKKGKFLFFDRTLFFDLSTGEQLSDFEKVQLRKRPIYETPSSEIFPIDENNWLFLVDKKLHFLDKRNFIFTESKKAYDRPKQISRIAFRDTSTLVIVGEDELFYTYDLSSINPVQSYADLVGTERESTIRNSLMEVTPIKDFAIISRTQYETNRELDDPLYLFEKIDFANRTKQGSLPHRGYPTEMIFSPDGIFSITVNYSNDKGEHGNYSKLWKIDTTVTNMTEVLTYSWSADEIFSGKIHDCFWENGKIYVLTSNGVEVFDARKLQREQLIVPLPDTMTLYTGRPTEKITDRSRTLFTGQLTIVSNRYLHCAIVAAESFKSHKEYQEYKDYKVYDIFTVYDLETDSLIYFEQNKDFPAEMIHIRSTAQSATSGRINGVKIRDKFGKLVKVLEAQPGAENISSPDLEIKTMAVNPGHKIFAVAGLDGVISLWNTKDWTKLGDLFLDKQEHFFITPDGYYTVSKNNLEGVAFRIGLSSYPLEQFDLNFNRPDIVLGRIGFTPEKEIVRYSKAHQKRLDLSGVGNSGQSQALPTAKMLNLDSIHQKVGRITSDSILVLKVQVSSDSVPLSRLLLWVNDVPVFGKNGRSLEEGIRHHTTSLPIPLMEGSNKIQLAVRDQNGWESYKETLEIEYQPAKPVRSNLYLVGIGVSDYQNLPKLPDLDRDIKDLVAAYGQKKEPLFDSVIIDTLLNASANREAILSLKDRLLQSKEKRCCHYLLCGTR